MNETDEIISAQNIMKWVPRNIEPTIAKWMTTSCAIVLIRGHRRMGKSSTVQRVAKELNIELLTIIIDNNDDHMLSHFARELDGHCKSKISSIYDVGKAIVEAVRNGVVIVLEEIQNATTSLQVSLQFGFDHMAQQSMWAAHDWRNSGMVFLMGSVQGAVDDMIENRKTPLYQRITAKITLLGCDTSEMVYFFKQHNLFGDPMLMLFLETIFRGRLHTYSIVHKAGLLQPTDVDHDRRGKIIKEVFASELQSEYFDGDQFFVARYGKKIALALKAICQSKSKQDQIKKVSAALNISDDESFTMIDWVLFKRYSLVEPVYSISNLNRVIKYSVLDPMLTIAVDNISQPKREDVYRSTDLPFQKYIEQYEDSHFESWVQTIIEDRYLLANAAPIPSVFHVPELCKRLPKVVYDMKGKDIEIDVILGFPHSNTIVVGSCKRSPQQTDVKGLRRHWTNLKEDQKCFPGILSRFGLNRDGLRECLVHFNTGPADARFHNELADEEYIVTLTELLDVFPLEMSSYREIYTKPGAPETCATPQKLLSKRCVMLALCLGCVMWMTRSKNHV